MYLGIDIGTSSVKALVLDDAGEIRSQCSAALQVTRPHPLWSEQDPQSWWTATVAAVGGLPLNQRRLIRAIGLAGQMHGATLLDAADRPLRPAILWNDGRSVRQCFELEAREPRSRSITGNPAMPGFTAPKLLWVREHEPDLFGRVTCVLLPKDYVRLRLTGEKISDMSDASGTLWLDVARREWSDAMLAATGIDRSTMPGLVEGTQPSARVTAAAAAELGIDRVVVAGGGGDNAASAVGLGVVRPGDAFLSLGTSGVLFVVNERFRPNPDRAAHAFCHCLPATWHQMAVTLSAGAALEWAAAVSGHASVPAAVAAAARRGIGRHTPTFLPYLTGERTPHNDPHARGAFYGLTLETEAADLVTAALIGVALAFTDGLDVLLEAGASVGEIALCGGGSRLDHWAELLASALDRPLTRRRGGDAGAALGAARLGRAAIAGPADLDLFAPPPQERTFEPDASIVELLRERRSTSRRLYGALKSVREDHDS